MRKHRIGKRSGPANVEPPVQTMFRFVEIHPSQGVKDGSMAPSPASGEWLAWWERRVHPKQRNPKKWKALFTSAPHVFSQTPCLWCSFLPPEIKFAGPKCIIKPIGIGSRSNWQDRGLLGLLSPRRASSVRRLFLPSQLVERDTGNSWLIPSDCNLSIFQSHFEKGLFNTQSTPCSPPHTQTHTLLTAGLNRVSRVQPHTTQQQQQQRLFTTTTHYTPENTKINNC
ncbi:hypothetical protein B0H65DRAFT_69343 [Neurospora tetraspora]|uniref:Uncharacterized protein n=1 Tax=Neurospora tetraspora TaxID=94610 RepID=A0AAE0MX52_9PEZI|nr:hypothetical protein B0H65DRAFT_69343 [Neurospora tetraspora]